MKKQAISVVLMFAFLFALFPAKAGAADDTVTITLRANDQLLITENGYQLHKYNTAPPSETAHTGEYIIKTVDSDNPVPCHVFIYSTTYSGDHTITVTLDNANMTGIEGYSAGNTPLEIGSQPGSTTTAVIKLVGENRLQGLAKGAGLTVPGVSSRPAQAIIEGPGSLETTGGDYAPGIGYGCGEDELGTITINSGTVRATGGRGAAGIGRGNRLVQGSITGVSTSGTININGGTVYAEGTLGDEGTGSDSTPYGAAGIGLGYCEDGFENKRIVDEINITGGTVTAKGAGRSACIGGTYGVRVILTGGVINTDGEFLDSSAVEIGRYTGSMGVYEFCDTGNGYSGNAVIYVSGPDKITTTSTSSPTRYWNCIVYEGDHGKVYTADYSSSRTITFTESDAFSIPDGKTLEITDSRVLKLPEGSAGLLSGRVTAGSRFIEMGETRYYMTDVMEAAPCEIKDAGGIYHNTLDDAFEKGAVTQDLLTDVSYDKTFTFAHQNSFYFYLKGHTWNLNSGQLNTDLDANPYYNSNRFTLYDGSAAGTGKITGNSAGPVVLCTDGKLAIVGGIFENTGSGPAVQFNGTVKGNNLTGGKFSKIEYVGKPLVGALASGYGFRQTGSGGETWWISAGSAQTVLEDVTVAQVSGTLPAITPALTVSEDSVSIAEVPGASYQWYEDGTAISGATGSTLALNRVSQGEHSVTCHVTVDGVTVTSDPSAVTGTKLNEPVTLAITGDPSKTYDGLPAVLGADGYTVTPAYAKVTVEYAAAGSTAFSADPPINAGAYTVRVSAGDQVKTADFTIARAEPAVSVVYEGGPLYVSTDPADVTLTVVENVGSAVLTADKLTVGTSEYTWLYTPDDLVNYTTKTGTITLTVAERAALDSITATAPGKTGYIYGEEFDKTSVTVTASYVDGTSETITAYQVAYPGGGTAFEVGDTSVTLRYTESGVTKTCEITGLTVSKAAGQSVTAAPVTLRYDDTDTQEIDLSGLVAEEAADSSGLTYTLGAGTEGYLANPGIDGGRLTFAVEPDIAELESAATVTVPVTVAVGNLKNYEDWTIRLTVMITKKTVIDSQLSLTIEGWSYGSPANAPVLSGGELALTPEAAAYTYSGTANNGMHIEDAPDAPTDAGSYTVTAVYSDDDYMGTATADFTIAKARPSGEPGYTKITASGRVLADAALNAGTIQPAGGAIVWDDGSGAAVEQGRAYGWTYTPGDINNYETLTGSITVWEQTGGSSGGGSSSGSGSSGTTVSTDADGNRIVTRNNSDGSQTITMTQPGGASSTTTVYPNGQMEASVRLPAGASTETAVLLPVPDVPVTADAAQPSTITIHTAAPAGTVRVEIPVAAATPGTVAVLVQPDGTETVLRQTVQTQRGIAVAVPDGATVKIVDNSKDFADAYGHWAKDSIDFATSRELFTGTSDTAFSPDMAMTRAMMATILARYDGQDTAGGSVWYEKGLSWAMENGISDGSAPDSNVSREQIVTMLYRYAGSPAVAGTLADFPDSDAVNAYAVRAMIWAVENGIIQGDKGMLRPQDDATRAQVAAILERFCQNSLA